MQIEVGTNPFTLFDSWYREAVEAEINDPDAIALASVNAAGMPSCLLYTSDAADEE